MLSQSTALSSIGYQIGHTIGEGGNAKVMIGIKLDTNEPVAIKVVKKIGGPQGQQIMNNLLKEVKIHSSVSHKNIIELFTTTEDNSFVYLIMEFAHSGELFDRIAPDVGIEEDLCHLFFQQLLSGMQYCHDHGIAHRDLKPENLLLDVHGNLKIIDFGLATVFKHKGVTRYICYSEKRILTTPCGSPPYVSPEVHTQKYRGDMSDIWSMGVILYVMLVGNTPWAEPTQHDEEFVQYVNNYPMGLSYNPWNRVSQSAFGNVKEFKIIDLLVGILNINADQRFTINDIRRSDWFQMPQPMLTNGRLNNPAAVAERMKSKINLSGESIVEDAPIAYSQPTDLRANNFHQSQMMDYASGPHVLSFSQPSNRDFGPMNTDDGFPTSYLGSPASSFMDVFPSERITRFYSQYEPEHICQRICVTFDQFLVQYRENQSSHTIWFSTVDKRKCPMQGEACIQIVGGENLCLGDPLEWKRFYHAMKESLIDLVCQ